MAQLKSGLTSDNAAVQRAAAEALGRIGDPGAVPDLLTAAAAPVDRFLEHSIIYALIEINTPAVTATSGLQVASSHARRAALIALDQMDAGTLTPDQIVPLLNSADAELKQTAWWIAGGHPEWGRSLAAYFTAHLAAPATSGEARRDLHLKLAQFGADPAIQQLLAAALEAAASKEDQLAALQTMAAVGQTRLKQLPDAWAAALLGTLQSDDDDVVQQALPVVRAVAASDTAAPRLNQALLGLARDQRRSIDTRLDALAAVRHGQAAVAQPGTANRALEQDVFELLRSSLAPAQPARVRSAAAGVIEKASLDPAQLAALVPALETAGPLELPRLVRAYGHGGDQAAGLALLAALRQAKSRSSVRADLLRPVLASYPEPVRKEGEALLSAPALDSTDKVRRLEALLRTIQGGDVARGQLVFNGPRAACVSCHAIGYMGGTIGPDLTRIGQVRSERDLLEAIVFPSASFARGYEPITVRTRSGEVRGGVLRSESPEEIVLGTAQGEESRIARRDIAEIQPGAVSLMPEGFDQQLTSDELSDLLAFLKATRSGAD